MRLDAAYGKTLADQVTKLNSDVEPNFFDLSFDTGSNGITFSNPETVLKTVEVDLTGGNYLITAGSIQAAINSTAGQAMIFIDCNGKRSTLCNFAWFADGKSYGSFGGAAIAALPKGKVILKVIGITSSAEKSCSLSAFSGCSIIGVRI